MATLPPPPPPPGQLVEPGFTTAPPCTSMTPLPLSLSVTIDTPPPAPPPALPPDPDLPSLLQTTKLYQKIQPIL